MRYNNLTRCFLFTVETDNKSRNINVRINVRGYLCVIIPIKNLPNIKVHGKLFPKAYFIWSDFKLINKNTESEIIIGKSLSLNWCNAVKLQKITKQYNVCFYWEHNGWLEPISAQ